MKVCTVARAKFLEFLVLLLLPVSCRYLRIQTLGAPGMVWIDDLSKMLKSVAAPATGVRYEFTPRFEACMARLNQVSGRGS